TSQNIPDPLPDLSDPLTARSLTPAENFNVIKNGRIEKLMPPWGNRLSDTQIWDLTAYVWSLSTSAENITAGETIYTQQCTACHGSGGAGDGPQATSKIVNLADPVSVVQQSQADWLTKYRATSQHVALNNLSEVQLNQALDYIRTFTFKMPQRNGVLTGQVVNATTNKPQGNISVTLRAFDNNTEFETKTVQTDAVGNYKFDRLLTDHAILYTVEGSYGDVLYFSPQPGIFTSDKAETTLNLNIYETTASPENVVVKQLHYLLSFSPEAVNVVQIFVLGNKGNKTYIGENGQTLTFALPEQAQDVAFQNDEAGRRFKQNGTTYTDTAPITPGEESQSIVATYKLPYQDNLTLKVPLPLNVPSANVLVQDQGAELNSSQLQFVEKREFQGDSFSIFSATDLKKGQELTLQLTNLDNLSFTPDPTLTGTVAPGPQVNQDWLRWLVLGLGGLIILGVALGYPHLKPAPQVNLSESDPDLQRQKLLLMLARLDELFETGELDKQLYHRARAKYKAELVGLMEEV
ncbi:MAG: c-type cytochrome, partial [Anaerolineae bacterium]